MVFLYILLPSLAFFVVKAFRVQGAEGAENADSGKSFKAHQEFVTFSYTIHSLPAVLAEPNQISLVGLVK